MIVPGRTTLNLRDRHLSDRATRVQFAATGRQFLADRRPRRSHAADRRHALPLSVAHAFHRRCGYSRPKLKQALRKAGTWKVEIDKRSDYNKGFQFLLRKNTLVNLRFNVVFLL